MHDAFDIFALLAAVVAIVTWLIGLVGCWRGRPKVSLLSCAVLFLLPWGMMVGEDFFPEDTDYAFIPIIILIWAAFLAGAAIVGIVFTAGSLQRKWKVK